MIRNDDEIEGVFAHEMSHVNRAHVLQRVYQAFNARFERLRAGYTSILAAALIHRRPFAGALVTLSMTLSVGGLPILVGAPALAGTLGRPGALLVPPIF